MKFVPFLILILAVGGSGSAQASGIIVESIKSHIDQHQSHARPRQYDQRQVTPAPQPVLEQWVRAMLDALARSR